MKVPPTNNSLGGFDGYDDEPYFSEGPVLHTAPAAGTAEDYNPPVEDSDFSEYMWMENEEEFDKEVMQRLEEEELMEQCMLQHMLEDERPNAPPHQNSASIETDLANLNLKTAESSEMAKGSTLNPHAAEFIPSWRRPSAEPKSS